jgi:tellurite resistance protein TerC
VARFHLLKYALGLVLIFVGLKMAWLNDLYGGKFPIGVSLAVIAIVIGASILLSLLYPKRPAEAARVPLPRAVRPGRPRSAAR